MAGLADDVKSNEDIHEFGTLAETIRRVKGMGYQICAATTMEDKEEVMDRYIASGARAICNECDKPLHIDVGEIEVEYVDEEECEHDHQNENEDPNQQEENEGQQLEETNVDTNDHHLNNEEDNANVDDNTEVDYNADNENENPEEAVITVVAVECCKCEDLEPAEQVGFAWPSTYDKEEKTANFKRWAKWYQNEKLPRGSANEPIFDLQKFANDFIDKDFVDILTRRKEDLRSMMNGFLEARRHNEDTDEKAMECLGSDTIMFLCDLNIDCMDQIHFVMMNNAFNRSDPNKYRLDDKELQLIFSFISSMVKFMEITKIVNGEKSDDEVEENELKDDFLDDGDLI